MVLLSVVCCSPKLLTNQRIVSVDFLDFRKYTAEGFFISPNMYTGAHETLGEIVVSVYPAKVVVEKETAIGGNLSDIYSGTGSSKSLKLEYISNEELLDMIVTEAKARKANALVNFKFEKIYSDVLVNNVAVKSLSHYQLSGLSIRRE
jgi:hypothetical protein